MTTTNDNSNIDSSSRFTRNSRRSRRQYRRRDEPVAVVAIETVEMTAEQRATAVACLGSLIAQWQQNGRRESDSPDLAA
jgi:hypothetical protein